MGKYLNEYNRLMEQKISMEKLHSRLLNQYGHIMSNEARALNEANWSMSEQMYNRDIEIAQKNALNEMAAEDYQRVMQSLQVEVRNEASPAIKELKKEIDNLFKK